MFKQIFDNDYITIAMNQDDDTMAIEWKTACGNIVDDAHKREQMKIRQLVEEYQPDKLLVNMEACYYHILPGTGPWHEHTLFSMYADLPPNRIALLVPRNLFAHAFFDAARAREKVDPNTRFQYFNNLDQAKEWLDHAEPLGT
jgi:hypothetical protein